MSLPKKIKAFNLFADGQGLAGTIKKITLPKLGRKFEEYRADVMDGPIEIDLGGDKLEASFTVEEHNDILLAKYGLCNHAGVRLRMMASAESDDCEFDEIQIVMHGRWREVDMGDIESGNDNSMDVQMAISHYEYIKNGVEIVYIDRATGVERVGGVDRTAERRRNLGLNY